MEAKKVLFVCGWCLTDRAYADYPDSWDYFWYTEMSIKQAVESLKFRISQVEYDVIIGHSIGCDIIHLAGLYEERKVIYISPCITQIPRLTLLYKSYKLCPSIIYKSLERCLGNRIIEATYNLLSSDNILINQLIEISKLKQEVFCTCLVIRCTKYIIPKCKINGAEVVKVTDCHLPLWRNIELIVKENFYVKV